jgi:hypothetical protein
MMTDKVDPIDELRAEYEGLFPSRPTDKKKLEKARTQAQAKKDWLRAAVTSEVLGDSYAAGINYRKAKRPAEAVRNFAEAGKDGKDYNATREALHILLCSDEEGVKSLASKVLQQQQPDSFELLELCLSKGVRFSPEYLDVMIKISRSEGREDDARSLFIGHRAGSLDVLAYLATNGVSLDEDDLAVVGDKLSSSKVPYGDLLERLSAVGTSYIGVQLAARLSAPINVTGEYLLNHPDGVSPEKTRLLQAVYGESEVERWSESRLEEEGRAYGIDRAASLAENLGLEEQTDRLYELRLAEVVAEGDFGLVESLLEDQGGLGLDSFFYNPDGDDDIPDMPPPREG